MESLLRTRVGRYGIQDSLKLSQIEALRDNGMLLPHIIPIDQMFPECAAYHIRPEYDHLVHNGNPFLPCHMKEDEKEEGAFHKPSQRARVYDSQGHFIGIYQYQEEAGRYKPEKVFLPHGQNERK